MRGRVCLLMVAVLSAAACDAEEPTPAVTDLASPETTMKLTSIAFQEGDPIPSRFTCDGADLSPQLDIAAIPEGTATLALIVDDPDAPRGTWIHWVAYDIPVQGTIAEGIATLGTEGRNSSGDLGYEGPCPPSGTHRYFFRMYALDTTLGLAEGATSEELSQAMQARVLGEATLMGTYSR